MSLTVQSGMHPLGKQQAAASSLGGGGGLEERPGMSVVLSLTTLERAEAASTLHEACRLWDAGTGSLLRTCPRYSGAAGPTQGPPGLLGSSAAGARASPDS